MVNMTHTIEVGALADAEYVTGISGAVATLRGVVVSVAEPNSRFNAWHERVTSVTRPDGSSGTSSSAMPVTIIAAAGTDQARAAVRELLASGAWLNDRARAALEATL